MQIQDVQSASKRTDESVMRVCSLSLLTTALAAALSPFLFAGCSPTGEHYNVVHLSGVVRDSTNKTPLDSAWVALDDSLPGMKIVTETGGVFELAAVEFGVGTLYAGKSGYKTMSKGMRNVHHDVDSIFFDLEPSSR